MSGDAEFGAELTRLMAALGISQAELARRLGKAPGVISFIRSGRRSPPLDQMPRWAEALGLRGSDRARFFELALLAHAPAELRAAFAAMRTRCQRLETELKSLRGEVRRAAESRTPYKG